LSSTDWGITTPAPLRQRASAYTSVLGTSLITAKPPAMSPYRVQ
jgi:hypothetical protein